MFADLFASIWKKMCSPWSRKRPIQVRRRKSVRRLQLETLEDRVMPATQLLGGLELYTSGQFAIQGNQVSATGPVQVGVAPQTGSAFTPLLLLNNGVQFNNTDPAGTFATNGEVDVFVNNQLFQLLDAQQHTFTAQGLLSASGYDLGANDVNQAHLNVAGTTWP